MSRLGQRVTPFLTFLAGRRCGSVSGFGADDALDLRDPLEGEHSGGV